MQLVECAGMTDQQLACTLTHWLDCPASELLQKSCRSCIFIYCICLPGQLYIQYWGIQVRCLLALGRTGLSPWALMAPEHAHVSSFRSTSFSFAWGYLGMLGIQLGDTSMLAGVWGCCTKGRCGVGASVPGLFTA